MDTGMTTDDGLWTTEYKVTAMAIGQIASISFSATYYL